MNNQEISKLYDIDVEDDKKRFYEQKAIRNRVEGLMSLKDLFFRLGWIDKNDDSVDTYEKMKEQVLFIMVNQAKVIKDYLSKDPELSEFIAIHGNDEIRSKYVPKVLERLNAKVISVPASEKMVWAVIKTFDGRPIKYERYPLQVTFEYDQFVVKDIAFDQKTESKMEKWRNAPILVL